MSGGEIRYVNNPYSFSGAVPLWIPDKKEETKAEVNPNPCVAEKPTVRPLNFNRNNKQNGNVSIGKDPRIPPAVAILIPETLASHGACGTQPAAPRLAQQESISPTFNRVQPQSNGQEVISQFPQQQHQPLQPRMAPRDATKTTRAMWNPSSNQSASTFLQSYSAMDYHAGGGNGRMGNGGGDGMFVSPSPSLQSISNNFVNGQWQGNQRQSSSTAVVASASGSSNHVPSLREMLDADLLSEIFKELKFSNYRPGETANIQTNKANMAAHPASGLPGSRNNTVKPPFMDGISTIPRSSANRSPAHKAPESPSVGFAPAQYNGNLHDLHQPPNNATKKDKKGPPNEASLFGKSMGTPCPASHRWKCLRVKLGIQHMLCLDCENRWRAPKQSIITKSSN